MSAFQCILSIFHLFPALSQKVVLYLSASNIRWVMNSILLKSVKNEICCSMEAATLTICLQIGGRIFDVVKSLAGLRISGNHRKLFDHSPWSKAWPVDTIPISGTVSLCNVWKGNYLKHVFDIALLYPEPRRWIPRVLQTNWYNLAQYFLLMNVLM